MLDSQTQRKINQLFNPDGTLSFYAQNGGMQMWLQNAKNNGFTEDDLKPTIDKLTQVGYSVGPDYSITGGFQGDYKPPPIDPGQYNQGTNVPKTTGPGTYTPAPPTQPNQSVSLTPNPTVTGPTDGKNFLLPGETPKGTPLPADTVDLTSDRGKTEQEAQREKIQGTQAVSDVTAQRQKDIADLATLLNTNASNQFQRAIPQVAEDANTAGIFRSTGLGNALATKESQLQQDVATQLGLAGVNASEMGAQEKLGVLGNTQGLQQSGLQRQFSLADFTREADLAKQVGSSAVPQVSSGKGAGAIGGAGVGLKAGSAFGPQAGVTGAILGAVGGGAAGSSK